VAEGSFDRRLDASGPVELAAMAHSFNSMAASIESLFAARRDLVVAASHDLRSPLASLQAMIEATQDGIVEPTHYLEAMAIRVQVLSDLVDDLFELSALDAGALRLEVGRAEVGELVRRCVGGHAAEADRRGLALTERIAAGLPPVRCAPDAMDRVLTNVVANAMRHTPAGGSVTVQARAADDRVQVVVSDTGCGFADPSRATEPFWRDDDARALDDDGRSHAGLGLAIARGLMELQGGALHVANEPTGGARVSLTLVASS
jgi:two-component system sensor histidine kinase BaeS